MSNNENTQRTPLLRGGEETIKFAKRIVLAAALGAGAVVSLVTIGESVLKTDNQPTLAGKLAQPFERDDKAVKSGKFAPGTVIKVPLIGGLSAYGNALNLTGGDAYSANEIEIQKDIQAEDGNLPGTGDKAYLPRADVITLPPGSEDQ